MSFRGRGGFNKQQRGGQNQGGRGGQQFQGGRGGQQNQGGRGAQQNKDGKIPPLFENADMQQNKSQNKGFDKSRLADRREQHKDETNNENITKTIKNDKVENPAQPNETNGNDSAQNDQKPDMNQNRGNRGGFNQSDMNQNRGDRGGFNQRRGGQNFQRNQGPNKFQNNRNSFPRNQQRNDKFDGRLSDKFDGRMGGRDRIQDKAKALGQLFDLEPMDMAEKKFNAFSKLFVTNLPRDLTQEELKTEFEKFGEISNVYIHKDTFAFITFDFKETANKARKEMHNKVIKGRNIQVRVASVNEGISVKNLSSTVSNEMLEKGFSIFGIVESARVNVDERGRSTGEGVVIFKDKRSATTAIAKCQEECYILTGTSRPVVVSPFEVSEVNEDGLAEANLMKDEAYNRDRSVAPHFATDTSFEFELSMEWKKIFQQYDDLKKQMQIDFDREIKRMEQKLVLARVEFEKDQLRRELAAREAESDLLRRRFEDMPGTDRGYSGDDRRYDPYMNPQADTFDRKVFEGDFQEQYDSMRPQEFSTNYNKEYTTNFNREFDRGQYNYDNAFDLQQNSQEAVGGQDRAFGGQERAFDAPAQEIEVTTTEDDGFQQQFSNKRLPPPPEFGPFKRARF